jgi:hypothetical protein
MASLANQSIASSYDQLLHVDTEGGGDGTTLLSIKDGDNGTTFALQISTTAAKLNGNLGINSAATYPITVASDDDDAHLLCSQHHDGADEGYGAYWHSRTDPDGTTGGSRGSAAIGSIYYDQSTNGGSDRAIGWVYMSTGDGASSYLWVDNSDQLRISTTGGHRGSTNGTIVGTQSSDERLKNINSSAFPYGLSEINQLTPIKYEFKNNLGVNKLGFGAQTMQSILPEVVQDTKECIDGYNISHDSNELPTETPKSSDSSRLSMEYVQIIPVLVKAVQELSAKVTALESA